MLEQTVFCSKFVRASMRMNVGINRVLKPLHCILFSWHQALGEDICRQWWLFAIWLASSLHPGSSNRHRDDFLCLTYLLPSEEYHNGSFDCKVDRSSAQCQRWILINTGKCTVDLLTYK